METKNELAVVPQKRDLTPSVWTVIKEMAPMMHTSRLFGVSSVEQATAIMVKGFECGFGFANSFDMIQVIQGKPGVSPRGALALIMGNPEITKVKIDRLVDDTGKYKGHSCTMERGKRISHTATFTMEDAKRAGLVKPDSGWEKYPENMCLWRAVGFCADIVAPDISAGMTNLMKQPEAYGVSLSETGDIIDVQAKVTEVKQAPPEITLTSIVQKYGPEAVMEKNGGKIPETQDEVNSVAMALENAQ